MTATDFWSPALAPPAPPAYPVWDDEIPDCRSLLMLLPDEDGRPRPALRCSLGEGHPLDRVDLRHGEGVARWSDEEAAAARVAWWAQFDGVCADCERLICTAEGTRCAGCRRARFADDHIETESEAA